jgi:ribosomal protein S27E
MHEESGKVGCERCGEIIASPVNGKEAQLRRSILLVPR